MPNFVSKDLTVQEQFLQKTHRRHKTDRMKIHAPFSPLGPFTVVNYSVGMKIHAPFSALGPSNCSKLQCGNKGCPLGRDPHCNFEYHPTFNNTLQHIVKMTNISDNEHLSIHTNTQAIGVKQGNTLVHDHLFFLLLLSHSMSNLECSLRC